MITIKYQQQSNNWNILKKRENEKQNIKTMTVKLVKIRNKLKMSKGVQSTAIR